MAATDPQGPAPDNKRFWQIILVCIGIGIVCSILIVMAGGLQSSGAPASSAAPLNTQTAPARQASSGATGTATGSSGAPKPVDFTLQTGDVTNCGLTCRQLTATLTNTGNTGAHNVCISIAMQNSKGEVIGLNGAGTLTKCVGDLGAGQYRSEPVTINADCGMFALKCIKETLTLQTWVTSDETTVRFPDTLLAV